MIARAVPKRDYYVTSPLGARLVSLDLGPVALAFVGTPSGMAPDEVRDAVRALAAEHGMDWPAAWLHRLGAPVPDGASPVTTRPVSSRQASYSPTEVPHVEVLSPG